MYVRDMKGHLTLTATWVICSKCGRGFIGDETLYTCPKCVNKHRNFVRKNVLDVWDWIIISFIPVFGTLFCYFNKVI